MVKSLLQRWRTRGIPANQPFMNMVPSGMDMRGLPSPECFCGGRMFLAVVYFDDARELAGWMLDGMCTDCKALVTLPTPIDLDLLEEES